MYTQAKIVANVVYKYNLFKYDAWTSAELQK